MSFLANWLRKTSLRRQLIIAVVLGVMSTVLLSALGSAWQGNRQIRKTLLEQGAGVAGHLARQSALALLFDSADNAAGAVETTLTFPDVMRVEIMHANGRRLLSRGKDEPKDAPRNGAVRSDVHSAILERETDDAWHFVAPVFANESTDSPFEVTPSKAELLGYVRVVQSKATLRRMTRSILVVNFVIALLFTLLFLTTIGVLGARLARPLTQLSDAMARAEGGQPRVRAEIEGPKDIADMAQTFNRMMTVLENREQELRHAHDALEVYAAEWERTFDAMETPILILDAGGRIARLNRAALQLAGNPSEEQVRGRPVAELGPGQPWQKAKEAAVQVELTRASGHGQVRDEASGKTWDVAAGPSPGPTDAEERVIVVARDVTETIRLQESLRRSETMSAMGMLVAGVAHEVRNPLFGISATLDAFEAKIGMRSELEPVTAVMRGEVKRLAALMQDLLDYGKPVQSGPSPYPIDAVVAEAVQSAAGLAEKSRVALVNRVGPGLPPVSMDRKRMVQVFQNLVQNAIQHSAEGGVVTLEARPEEDGSDGASLVLTVEDSGSGFSLEVLPRIFEPFFSHRRGGTGLGLAIVRRIVEEHGGTVVAANRPEGGAAMVVRLPCTQASVTTTTTTRRGSWPGGGHG